MGSETSLRALKARELDFGRFRANGLRLRVAAAEEWMVDGRLPQDSTLRWCWIAARLSYRRQGPAGGLPAVCARDSLWTSIRTPRPIWRRFFRSGSYDL